MNKLDITGSVFYRTIIGIDPGANGALVALQFGDGKIMFTAPFSQMAYKSWSSQKDILYRFMLNKGLLIIENIPTTLPSLSLIYSVVDFKIFPSSVCVR